MKLTTSHGRDIRVVVPPSIAELAPAMKVELEKLDRLEGALQANRDELNPARGRAGTGRARTREGDQGGCARGQAVANEGSDEADSRRDRSREEPRLGLPGCNRSRHRRPSTCSSATARRFSPLLRVGASGGAATKLEKTLDA